jgi:hypothetical protein
MMKRVVTVLAALLIVSAGLFALEPYDSDASKSIMRANGAAFGQLRAASSSGDFLAAAGALATLAEGSLLLLDYEAPQGSLAEWQRIHTELIAAALEGIRACSDEDADALAEVARRVGGFSQEGHGAFR